MAEAVALLLALPTTSAPVFLAMFGESNSLHGAWIKSDKFSTRDNKQYFIASAGPR